MFSEIKGCSIEGLNGSIFNVEINISNGIPCVDIVGQVDLSVKESRERIKAAIKNQGLKYPNQKITINLSPANVRKSGTAFDLAIAVGIIAASGQIDNHDMKDYLIIGELSLNGTIKRVTGVISLIIEAKKRGIIHIIVPGENVNEAEAIEGIKVFAFNTLGEVVDFFNGKTVGRVRASIIEDEKEKNEDLINVKGHRGAKRALEIAAAGEHSLMFIGSPGAGKTMLARCLPSILPPLSREESMEVTKIYSVMGEEIKGLIKSRPFRCPHHSITMQGLMGGGASPKPGEITLAHCGVLFLDELAEFRPEVLDAMRQPMEERRIVITRLKNTVVFPSRFMLLAAANPCRCGMLYEDSCTCSHIQVQKYRYRLSGPMLDRIEMAVHMSSISFHEMNADNVREESSQNVKERVIRAREVQSQRYSLLDCNTNSNMPNHMVEQYCNFSNESKNFLQEYYIINKLSVRGYYNIARLARTISDLDNSDLIELRHVTEASQYAQYLKKT